VFHRGLRCPITGLESQNSLEVPNFNPLSSSKSSWQRPTGRYGPCSPPPGSCKLGAKKSAWTGGLSGPLKFTFGVLDGDGGGGGAKRNFAISLASSAVSTVQSSALRSWSRNSSKDTPRSRRRCTIRGMFTKHTSIESTLRHLISDFFLMSFQEPRNVSGRVPF